MSLISLTAEAVSWLNVEIGLPTNIIVVLPTVRKIEYGSKVNTVPVYGAGNKMYDRTDGIIEVDNVKIEIGVSDWAMMLPALVAFAQISPINIANGLVFTGNNAMDMIYAKGTSFPITVSYQLLGNALQLSDIISDCRIVDVKMAPAQGPDPVVVTIELACQDVQRAII